jgi:hypothetical protein
MFTVSVKQYVTKCQCSSFSYVLLCGKAVAKHGDAEGRETRGTNRSIFGFADESTRSGCRAPGARPGGCPRVRARAGVPCSRGTTLKAAPGTSSGSSRPGAGAAGLVIRSQPRPTIQSNRNCLVQLRITVLLPSPASVFPAVYFFNRTFAPDCAFGGACLRAACGVT